MRDQTYSPLLDIFDQYLDIVQSDHRELDVWERLNLLEAVRMLHRGEVQYAFADFEIAITPPDNQSKDYPIPPEMSAKVAPLDLAWFRKTIAELRGIRGWARTPADLSNTPKSQWTALADTIGQLGLDILGGAPVTVTEKQFAEPKVLAIMLMSRTLSNFRGVFTLIENNLLVEARILVRCCFENAFWIAGLHSQGDEFVKKMFQDEVRSKRVRGEFVLSKKPQLSADVEKRLREQLRVKASPCASGDAIRSGGMRAVGIEQITNISCSRGRHDRRPGLPDRIPAALPG